MHGEKEANETVTVGGRPRNFWLHVAEGVFATFAGEIAPGPIIFPVIAAMLGASPFMLGVLSSIGGLSFVIQLVAAPTVEATRRKKRLVLILGLGQRLPMLLIPLALLLLAERHPTLCLFVIAGINLAGAAVISTMLPPWMDLIAETVPRDRVGRLFGFRGGISAALGLVTGGVCALIVASYAFPLNYAIVYLAGLGSMAVSWVLFALVDEVPSHTRTPAPRKAWAYYRSLIDAARRDVPYRHFLAYQGLSVLSKVSGPFYVMAAISVHGMDPAVVTGSFIMARAASRIAGNFAFPFLDERPGHKAVLFIGIVFHAAAACVAAVAPNGYWFIGVMLLQGMGMASQSVSGSAFMLSVCPGGRRVGYMTLTSLALTPVKLLALPAAGYFMQHVGPAPMFLAIAAGLLASGIPLDRCRPAPAAQASSGTARPGAVALEA